MKNTSAVLLSLTLLAGVTGCRKDITCETPVIRKVIFTCSQAFLKIPDTSYVLTKYKLGSGLGLVSDVYPETRLIPLDNSKYLELPEKGTETYDYDWTIVLKPSNITYTISEIKHESSTSKTHRCTNTVSYKVNDSLVTEPGNPYSATPYYTPDIEIEYW